MSRNRPLAMGILGFANRGFRPIHPAQALARPSIVSSATLTLATSVQEDYTAGASCGAEGTGTYVLGLHGNHSNNQRGKDSFELHFEVFLVKGGLRGVRYE